MKSEHKNYILALPTNPNYSHFENAYTNMANT